METITVNDKKFIVVITLRQDELLAPIILQLLTEQPAALTHAGEKVIEVFSQVRDGQEHINALLSGNPEQIDLQAIRKNIEETQKSSVSIAMDMMKATAWIYSKGFAKRIMAILLVPEGETFDETKIAEREEYFGKFAGRAEANAVITYFFQRSGVFGIGTAAFFPKEATK